MTTCNGFIRMAAHRKHPLALVLAGLCAAAPCAHATPVLPPELDAPLMTPRFAAPPPSHTPHVPNVVTVSNCDDSGPGSLREASGIAADGDTIDLSQLSCSTISLTTGAILLGQHDITVHGPGRDRLAIDASQSTHDGLGNVLFHLGGGTLAVDNVTLSGGRKYVDDQHVTGGCVYSNENVSITDATIRDCVATSASNLAALGGGVFATGFLNLDHSTIEDNQTMANGNGFSSGGGVYADGGIHALYSIVSGNTANHLGPTPTFGGGIFARSYAGIFESAVVGNRAVRAGGMAIAGVGSTDLAFVFQSTISRNRAYGVIGGMYTRQELYLYNSTIANNIATSTTLDGDNKGVGLHWEALHNLVMVSSIISDNGSDEPDAFDLGGPPSTPPGVSFSGNNDIIATTNLAPPPDTIPGPALLGPLTDNGGLTPTHALGAGSFAINAGAMPNLGVFTNDQRGEGFARWVGSSVDAGAFESDPDRIFVTGFNF